MKTLDELQAENVWLRGELAAARAYIAALEQAAAAMTAQRVLSDVNVTALVDGYPAYDAATEVEQ